MLVFIADAPYRLKAAECPFMIATRRSLVSASIEVQRQALEALGIVEPPTMAT
jgi:hypothetical protein